MAMASVRFLQTGRRWGVCVMVGRVFVGGWCGVGGVELFRGISYQVRVTCRHQVWSPQALHQWIRHHGWSSSVWETSTCQNRQCLENAHILRRSSFWKKLVPRRSRSNSAEQVRSWHRVVDGLLLFQITQQICTQTPNVWNIYTKFSFLLSSVLTDPRLDCEKKLIRQISPLASPATPAEGHFWMLLHWTNSACPNSLWNFLGFVQILVLVNCGENMFSRGAGNANARYALVQLWEWDTDY